MSWNSEWTGKYDLWNYVNSDEARLDDSARPRDKFWFRITPWNQTGKLDFKWANKNIYLSQCIAKWGKVVAGSDSIKYNTAYLKESYTSSDFDFLNSYTFYWWGTLSPSVVATDRKAEKFWDASVKFDSWNIVILKWGTYIIQWYCDFMYPNWYNPTYSYSYKEYVAILYKEKLSDDWIPWVRTQSRACWSIDWVNSLFVWYLKAGTILNTGFLHTYSSNVYVASALNVYRLSS